VVAERQLLQAVLQHPGRVPAAEFDALDGDAFTAPAHRAVHDAVRTLGGVGAAPAEHAGWTQRVRETVTEPARPLVGELAVAALPVDGEGAVRALAVDLVREVVWRTLVRQEAELRGRAQRLESAGDTDGASAAYGRLFELAAQRQRMRQA
jgi:DNA primase